MLSKGRECLICGRFVKSHDSVCCLGFIWNAHCKLEEKLWLWDPRSSGGGLVKISRWIEPSGVMKGDCPIRIDSCLQLKVSLPVFVNTNIMKGAASTNEPKFSYELREYDCHMQRLPILTALATYCPHVSILLYGLVSTRCIFTAVSTIASVVKSLCLSSFANTCRGLRFWSCT